jgi:Eukaryotic aspartyl protease
MNFILGSLSGVRAFYAKIPGSQDATSTVGPGFYTFPCLAAIPRISFTIGGKALDMSASSLILGPLKPRSSKCVGSIVADGSIANYFWMLGESWMRNYYTIFDYDSSRVGFADLK